MKKVLPSSKWQIVKDSETGSAEMEQIPEKKAVGEPVTVIEDDSTEPAADDPYAALSKLGIDVNTGLRYSQGDRDFYKTLILQFASELPHRRSSSSAPRRDSTEPRPRGCSGRGEPPHALPSF